MRFFPSKELFWILLYLMTWLGAVGNAQYVSISIENRRRSTYLRVHVAQLYFKGFEPRCFRIFLIIDLRHMERNGSTPGRIASIPCSRKDVGFHDMHGLLGRTSLCFCRNGGEFGARFKVLFICTTNVFHANGTKKRWFYLIRRRSCIIMEWNGPRKNHGRSIP